MAITYPKGPAVNIESRLHDLPLDHLSVLNLGAGSRETAFTPVLQPMRFQSLTMVEVFSPYVESLKGVPWATPVTKIIPQDILSFLALTDPGSYDVVLMTDVLEHFPKQVAGYLVKKMREVARIRTLIWLPLGEVPQDPYDGNQFQEHLSSWEADDPLFADAEVQLYPAFHRQFNPPADAAWVIWNKFNDLPK